MNNAKKYLKFSITILSIIAILYMLAIYIWASAYTILAADDFSDAVGLGLYRAPLPVHIWGAIRFMAEMYMYWQGTFSSMFLQALLNPINGFGLIQLRIVMITNVLLVFISLLLLVHELFNHIHLVSKQLVYVTSVLLLFLSFGCMVYQEVFFWYSGSTPFGYPFTFMILGITLFLQHLRTSKKKAFIGAIVFGFLACGGTLMITGACCYFGLLIFIYYSLKDSKVNKSGLTIFIWWFAGALVNVLAPGNYVRESHNSTKLSFLAAIKNSLIICLRDIKSLIKNSCLFEVTMICIILGIIIGLSTVTENKLSKRNNTILIIISLLTPISAWAASFPVTLGYGAGADWNLNNRCYFVINTCFIISIMLIAFVLGYSITSSFKNTGKIVIPALIIATLAWAFIFPKGITQNKYFELNHQLVNNEIQNYYYTCKSFTDELASYPDGSDVRIPMEAVPKAIDNTVDFYYYENPTNPENWLNEAFAKYYHLNSFALE